MRRLRRSRAPAMLGACLDPCGTTTREPHTTSSSAALPAQRLPSAPLTTSARSFCWTHRGSLRASMPRVVLSAEPRPPPSQSQLGNISKAMHWLGTCTAQSFNPREPAIGPPLSGTVRVAAHLGREVPSGLADLALARDVSSATPYAQAGQVSVEISMISAERLVRALAVEHHHPPLRARAEHAPLREDARRAERLVLVPSTVHGDRELVGIRHEMVRGRRGVTTSSMNDVRRSAGCRNRRRTCSVPRAGLSSWARIVQAIDEESSPPERHEPTGTSARNRSRTESSSSSRNRPPRRRSARNCPQCSYQRCGRAEARLSSGAETYSPARTGNSVSRVIGHAPVEKVARARSAAEAEVLDLEASARPPVASAI